jgi:peptide/nickel transport system permease protein
MIGQRLLLGVLTLLAVSILVFSGTALLPGDPAAAILGQNATPVALQAMRERLHLNEPASRRYVEWLWGVSHGDLGRSLVNEVPVSELVVPRLRNTLILTAIVTILFVPISVILGVATGLRPHRTFDHSVSSLLLVAAALPEFVIGTLFALLFALVIPIFPAVSIFDPSDTPLSHPDVLMLPVLTLLVVAVASTARMVRRSVIEVMEKDYVEMARLKGVRESTLIRRHILPNALAPTLQIVSLNIAWLLGGVVIVEFVFQYPGIGQGLANAVSTRDIPEVQAIAVILAALYIVLMIVADVISVLLTPRVRTSVK